MSAAFLHWNPCTWQADIVNPQYPQNWQDPDFITELSSGEPTTKSAIDSTETSTDAMTVSRFSYTLTQSATWNLS